MASHDTEDQIRSISDYLNEVEDPFYQSLLAYSLAREQITQETRMGFSFFNKRDHFTGVEMCRMVTALFFVAMPMKFPFWLGNRPISLRSRNFMTSRHAVLVAKVNDREMLLDGTHAQTRDGEKRRIIFCGTEEVQGFFPNYHPWICYSADLEGQENRIQCDLLGAPLPESLGLYDQRVQIYESLQLPVRNARQRRLF